MGAIIWLASYPKSGNTWLRAFLHNLLRNPDRPMGINELDKFCLGDSQAVWYQHVSGRSPAQMTKEEVAALRPRVHEAFTQAFPDSVFAKTHNILAAAFGQPMVTMDCTAGAIYVLRNPLDVTISLADHFGITLDQSVEFMANPQAGTENDDVNAFEFYGTWSQHVASWTREGNQGMIWLRYEDLLQKPNQSFGRVASYLGLKPSRQRLDKAIKFSSFKVLRSQEEREGFRERSKHAERFFRVGKASQWRTTLSTEQVDAIVAAHGEQMERFGYLP